MHQVRRIVAGVGLGVMLAGALVVVRLGWAGEPAAESQKPSVSKELKIYIVTDLEGASGVYKFAQTQEPGPLNEQAKEYLMGDIAAVVRGLRAGGATEILVLDGHGTQAFVPHLMEPGAKYITGRPRPGHPLWGLDESFAGLAIVGQHAMMGVPDGVLCHTQSSRTENRYWYNGVESGELAQVAAIAGYYGVPPILVTGDEAACREARQFFGQHCVTVAVKRGISQEAAVLYPFPETRKALEEGAKQAMKMIGLAKPYRLQTPIQAKKEYLIFEGSEQKPRRVVKEGIIEDVLKLLEF
ncbi:MAG: M55 family metallopeptidase [Thermoguttaceae bacterium]|nr:M55 family metallopeptidase [Thermoguttaceae bacterium]MDW8036725.1 M55 family metallopeptidase [Thermoguttaceae bacterium]